MTIVHVAFYKGTKKENPKSKFMDNVICFFTGSEFSHAELVIDYFPVEHNGNCWSSSEWDHGVRNKFMHLDPDRWVVIPVSTKFTKDELYEFFKKEEGKSYDYLGALGVVLPFLNGKPETWFCFEIVGTALGYVDASRYNADDLMEVLGG